MRFDQQVIFVTEGEEVYDPATGDYYVFDSEERLLWANVSHLGIERRETIYGAAREDSLVMRFRYRLPSFDHIIYQGRKYGVDTENRFRNKTVLVVSERQ